jgi:hypothetical protein
VYHHRALPRRNVHLVNHDRLLCSPRVDADQAAEEWPFTCPTGKSAKTCLALREKIFRLTRRANQRYQLARLTRQEGRLAIVTNVRWDAVDGMAAKDERQLSRTAKSCGPGAPMLALSFVEQSSAR